MNNITDLKDHKMSGPAPTTTTNTYTYVSSPIETEELECAGPSRSVPPPCRIDEGEQGGFNPDDEEYVHEDGCSCDNSDLETLSNTEDLDDHPFGECSDESCCDLALMYHSSDEVAYYRNKGMFFEDRGDGTGGDWYHAGYSMLAGKGTGVIFED